MSQTTLILLLLVVVAAALLFFAASGDPSAEAADQESGVPVVHNVYFKLKDDSPAKVDELVAACKKYLEKQPGVTFFASGAVAEGLDREVNDRDWDVGLHMMFKDRATHDRYQNDPQHKKFIEENKGNWEKVRVFDTDVR